MVQHSTSNEEFYDYRENYVKADRIVAGLLLLMFFFGIFIAFFYDTWLVAFGVGSLSLAAYFISKAMLPASNLYQYVLSVVTTIFAAQYIYQMHGMAEMHFWVFISSTVLIIYQNWRLQIPMILIVYVHHGLFAYLQYIGYKEVYFTQLDYMDLTTFIFHAVLATAVCLVSALWSYNMHTRTLRDAMNFKELSKLKEELQSVNEKLNNEVEQRTQALLEQNKKLIQHAFLNAHQVRGPLARILGLVNIIGYEIELNEKGKVLFSHLNVSANELDTILHQVRANLEEAEYKE